MRKTLFLAGALGSVASLMLAGTADASLKCRSTMAKTAAKYVQGYSKILQKCEEGVLAGKLSGTCPAADPKAAGKLAGLLAKVGPAISKACPPSETGIFTHGRCPDVEGGTADATNCSDIVVQNVDDISACITCIAAEEIDELNAASFNSGFVAQAAGSTEAKCQAAIGKNTAAFFQTQSKLLSKCRDGQLKGKITTTCELDPKTADGLASAEAKKVAAICKACGGADKACGPETCQNAGATNGNVCTVNSACNVCSDDQAACGSTLDCNTCTAGFVGGACDADVDCRVCTAGNVGAQCELGNGACNICSGGSNPGAPCPIGAFQCLGGGTCGGGTCAATVAGSCAAGAIATCGGGDCQGTDDLKLADIGFTATCPGITGGNGAVVQSLGDIIDCVDATASTRGNCTDAIGASSQTQNLPLGCENNVASCVGNQGAATIQVTVASSVGNLGAISVALGYKDANVAGTGELDPVTGPVQPTFFNGQVLVTDNERQVVVSIVASDPVGDPIPVGMLFDADVSKCLGFVSADDVSCVVRDAADATGATILEGVTCSVSVL
jgi:hypothetical protein